ncbi:hypothetical protein K6V78_03685 [Streptococcus gallolyticus]|nr:hypothetical protein [Streptococcus gallolyticus]MBY5040679.1 hypothetical protein [Streptococcus gallolyticus]
MKKRWMKIRFTFFNLLLLFSPLTIFADEKTKSSEVFKNKITFEEGMKYLDRFTSKVWVDKGWFGLDGTTIYLINYFVQGIFWISKTIVFVAGSIYGTLANNKDLDNYVDTALAVGAGVYKGLYTNFAGMSGTLMGLWLAYIFFVKNGKFGATLLRIFLAFTCSIAMFSTYNGKYALRYIYDGIDTVVSEVSTKSLSSMNKLYNEGSQNNSKLAGNVNNSSVVLDKYFDVAIWTPYKYMNSTYKISSNKDSVNFDLSDSQLKSLLDYDSGNNEFKVNGEEEISAVVGDPDDLKQPMLSASWGKKFTYAITSLFDALVLGAILAGISITAFSLKLIVLALLMLGGFIAILGMIPSFENIMYNFYKKMGGYLVISGLLQVVAIFVLWVYDILTTVLNGLFVGNPLIVAFLKCVVIFLTYKKRDALAGIFTGNRMTRLSNNVTRRIDRAGRNMTRKASQKAVGRMKQASTVANQFGRGATVIAGRKVGSALGNKVRHFKPLADKESKTNLYKEGVKDVGRKMKSVGHKTAGTFRNIRAEGVKNKSSLTYKNVKTKANRNMKLAKENAEKSLGFRQRKHNLETKQRLKLNREKRKSIKPTVKSGKVKVNKSVEPVKSIRPNRQDSIIVKDEKGQDSSNPFVIKEDKKPKFRRK